MRKTRNAIFSLDEYDVEQAFIDNGFEPLVDDEVEIEGVNLYLTGTCETKTNYARTPAGETRPLDQDETEVISFSITGNAFFGDDFEPINFIFVDTDKQPLITNLKM